jgi:hypothetical protein
LESKDDHTAEIHLDELLELVEPVSVPYIMVGQDQSEPSITRQKPIPKSRPARRKLLISVAIVTAVLALGGLLVWIFWPEPSGYLSVVSGLRAEIYVDGKRMGLAPLHGLPLQAGSHMIEVRRPGRSQVRRYRRIIRDGKHTKIRVKWKRKTRRKRKARRKKRS